MKRTPGARPKGCSSTKFTVDMFVGMAHAGLPMQALYESTPHCLFLKPGVYSYKHSFITHPNEHGSRDDRHCVHTIEIMLICCQQQAQAFADSACQALKAICALQGKVHWARTLRTAKHQITKMRLLLEKAESHRYEVHLLPTHSLLQHPPLCHSFLAAIPDN